MADGDDDDDEHELRVVFSNDTVLQIFDTVMIFRIDAQGVVQHMPGQHWTDRSHLDVNEGGLLLGSWEPVMSRKTKYQLKCNIFHDKNDEARVRGESTVDDNNRVLDKVMHRLLVTFTRTKPELPADKLKAKDG